VAAAWVMHFKVDNLPYFRVSDSKKVVNLSFQVSHSSSSFLFGTIPATEPQPWRGCSRRVFCGITRAV
jgi:hypothetical protein